MRWCTYSTATSGPTVGLVDGSTVYGLRAPRTLIEMLGSPEAMTDAARSARSSPSQTLPLADVHLHAPVPVPPSVRDFMAFEEHVVTSSTALGMEVDPLWYEIPVFYFSNPAAIRGPYDPIPISPGSEAWDFELEIAAVIGIPGSDISGRDADRHIAGYTVLCDWSARDVQEREMRLHLGPAKSKDSATTLGPVLVTPEELEPYRKGNSYDLKMTATVNGNPYSLGNFSAIHWSFGAMLEHASRGTELRTGDVIGSGTVGTGCILELSRTHGLDSYPWLKPGDVVTMSIEHIGQIKAVVAPCAPRTRRSAKGCNG